tara:strand:- start:424 stop:2115 length:1692 start_codon:yes stop_codon:yes gene_type:complete
MKNSINKYLILLTLFILQIQGSSDLDGCPGIVYDAQISNVTFTGKCSESGDRLWGVTFYKDEHLGDDFRGLYTDDERSFGSYVWENGDFMKGHWLSSYESKMGQDFNFFGKTFIANGGDQALGYFDDEKINGFALYVFSDDDDLERTSEVGLFKKNVVDGSSGLHGYGKRVINLNDNWWGFWEDGQAVGNVYLEREDEPIEMYSRNDGKFNGPLRMTTSDHERLKKIKNFVYDNLESMNEYWDDVQISLDKYDEIIDKFFSASDSNDSNEEEKSYAVSELVRSIQELLIEVGYSPGKPDGVLGKRTSAAIKAFQYSIDLEPSGSISEDLLIALQMVIKSENRLKEIPKSITKADPTLISSGTGFYINPKIIVTNNHVVESCEYLTNSDGSKLKLVQADQANDLAILEGPYAKDFLSISSASPALGEKIYVAGYPYSSLLKDFNFTSGNVSSLMGLGQDVANFKITAPVQPGNSGGAILNEYGSVVGVVVARLNNKFMQETYDSTPQNINFGIKNTILKILLSDNDIENYEEEPDYIKPQKFVALSSRRASILIQCYGQPNAEN